MEPRLKLSKAEDEPTQYRKMVGCLRYLLHTRPYLTYSIGVVSRYMQSPRKCHARAIKYLKVQLLLELNTSEMFSTLVHHPLHGAYKSKLSWRYLRVTLSSWQPLSCMSSNLAKGGIGRSDEE
ncbi:uncharacterized mitochondrial protein-like protein [Tanacetum coccineum]